MHWLDGNCVFLLFGMFFVWIFFAAAFLIFESQELNVMLCEAFEKGATTIDQWKEGIVVCKLERLDWF
jgi:hypothetical protein